MDKLYLKFGSMVASLALVFSFVGANAACFGALHQPELPENVKKLRRF
ncbi:MAG: cyclic lactone autoinducer peptide [Defluviitaleaceae bacterium]|nr:cyclic lactone autoinducer peptide [Defluviitaleaceae bacterium]